MRMDDDEFHSAYYVKLALRRVENECAMLLAEGINAEVQRRRDWN